MSAPPTNNAFLLWLQDDSHNDFLTKKALQEMYVCFDASAASPLAMLKDDDRKHCLLAFVKEGGCTTAALLYHAERFPARMGRPTPWDGKWFMTAGQAIAGHWLTYNMPDDILDCTAGPSQTYVADRIQREIADTPGVRELEISVSDENLEDLILISTLNLLLVLFGAAHPLSVSYQSFIALWNSLSVQLAEQFGGDPAKPALFLRSVQLRMSVYWQTVSTLSTSQSRLQMAPNFSELLTAIRIQTWQPPTMPGVPVSVPSMNAKTPPAVLIEQSGGLGAPEPTARSTKHNKSHHGRGNYQGNGRKAVSTPQAICKRYSPS